MTKILFSGNGVNKMAAILPTWWNLRGPISKIISNDQRHNRTKCHACTPKCLIFSHIAWTTWTFFENIGFNTVLMDPLCHIWLLNLDILQGSFRLCNWLSLRRLMSWINHLPPACWSTFWKSNFKQQLGCRFDIMDNIFFFFFFLDVCNYICLDTSDHFSVLPS